MRARRVIASGVAALLVALVVTASDLILEEEFLGWSWPWLWGFACATCIVAAIRPNHLQAWAFAGLSLEVVILARVAGLWQRVPDDIRTAGQEAVSVQRAIFGTFVYLLLVWLAACLWWVTSPRRYP